ncbi:HGL340Cp [Eremothecium sinecaudum]|uniref:Transcription factor n=1 Tax=Eremothecium sinecaudum TaxID=45286 RepID=A0A0X8HV16_9SACH|nr:HGL340Cp [Eremothecium sinecaudum]AMD22000.1 HGL340Cp [Eremothecium sinecaudum]
MLDPQTAKHGDVGGVAHKPSMESGNGTRTAYNDFVRKLFAILESREYINIISWTKEGDSFVVVDTNEFTTNILPKHFKHSNFSSFVRQLNKYDFHKVKRTPEERRQSEYGEYSWEFRHPQFRRNDEAALDKIKRKTVTQKKVSINDDVLSVSGRPNTMGGTLAGASDLGSSSNMLLANAVDFTSFNKLRDRVNSLEINNHQLQNDNTQLKGEVRAVKDKYTAILDTFVAMKSLNEQFLKNFSVLSTTLAQQGIKIPHGFPGIDMYSPQLSKVPSPISSQGFSHERPIDPMPAPSHPMPQNSTAKEVPLTPTIFKPGFNVLLVEDNSVCIELCSKFLRKYGCSVVVVTDGLSAIETIEKFRFDLVLMDIVMPNLDGATATSIIRSFDNQTPIIAMTGNIEDQDLVTYLQHGMTDILAKPFTTEDLHSMLVRYLKNRVPLTEQSSATCEQALSPQNMNQILVPKKEQSNRLDTQTLIEDGPLLKKTRVSDR